MIGVAVAGLLLIYTTRFGVRNYVENQAATFVRIAGEAPAPDNHI
jgi:hypothetical protein